MVQAVLQASVGHKVLYIGLAQSPAHQVQMARGAHKCSVLGDRNSGLHRALLGWVVKSSQKWAHMLLHGM